MLNCSCSSFASVDREISTQNLYQVHFYHLKHRSSKVVTCWMVGVMPLSCMRWSTEMRDDIHSCRFNSSISSSSTTSVSAPVVAPVVVVAAVVVVVVVADRVSAAAAFITTDRHSSINNQSIIRIESNRIKLNWIKSNPMELDRIESNQIKYRAG